MKEFLNTANRILFSVNCGLTVVVLALAAFMPFALMWCGNLFIWLCNIPICIVSFGTACSSIQQIPYVWFSNCYWIAMLIYFVCMGGWMIPIVLALQVSCTNDVISGKSHLT